MVLNEKFDLDQKVGGPLDALREEQTRGLLFLLLANPAAASPDRLKTCSDGSFLFTTPQKTAARSCVLHCFPGATNSVQKNRSLYSSISTATAFPDCTQNIH